MNRDTGETLHFKPQRLCKKLQKKCGLYTHSHACLRGRGRSSWVGHGRGTSPQPAWKRGSQLLALSQLIMETQIGVARLDLAQLNVPVENPKCVHDSLVHRQTSPIHADINHRRKILYPSNVRSDPARFAFRLHHSFWTLSTTILVVVAMSTIFIHSHLFSLLHYLYSPRVFLLISVIRPKKVKRNNQYFTVWISAKFCLKCNAGDGWIFSLSFI